MMMLGPSGLGRKGGTVALHFLRRAFGEKMLLQKGRSLCRWWY
jgi:hypothetical protein